MEQLFGLEFNLLGNSFRTFLLCTTLGLYLRFLIAFISNERWLKNYSQLLVFALLPLTGYLITSVISNNIALSLGMVGALSIVRFRTPVKNPSELVVYFVLITLGIVINVDKNLAVNFIIFVSIVIFIIQIYKLISKQFNLQEIDFDDSDVKYLKINCDSINEEAENRSEIIHKSFDGNYLYIFADTDKETLYSIEKMFDKDTIISSSIDF